MERQFVIDAQGISKSYGKGSSRFDALKDVTLQVERGECVAIVGKSGSGKSTLMHIIAMLDEPDAGTIEFNGTNARVMSAKRVNALRNKEFGFVFQQFFLTAGASVLDNVTLPLTIAGIPPAARKERGLRVLRQFELEDKANSNANDLSGGQKQRVVISRALVNEPSVIFADEPTGNLDTATGGIVEDTLFNLNRELGITLIIVTHDEELAARCDRQVFLRDGVIVSSLTASSTTSQNGAAA